MLMPILITAVVSLAIGGYLGMRYGRGAAQKAVSVALADIAAVDATAAAVRAKLSARLSYLRKVL